MLELCTNKSLTEDDLLNMDNAGNGGGYEKEKNQDPDIINNPEWICPGNIQIYK